MGSRLFSNTTNLLGGHDFTNADHRRQVARSLNINPDVIPQRDSWAYHEIIEGILRGTIKGLWIVATNTAHSWINQRQVRDILGRLDFLVAQDMYHTTDTARVADLVLPAAGWGEKDGAFINSERRIGVIKMVASAPGQALADFAIFKLVAEYWGCAEMFREWESPEATFQVLKRLSQGQPCDITGIADYRMLEQRGGIQWPYPDRPRAVTEAPERRLFEDGGIITLTDERGFSLKTPGRCRSRPARAIRSSCSPDGAPSHSGTPRPVPGTRPCCGSFIPAASTWKSILPTRVTAASVRTAA